MKIGILTADSNGCFPIPAVKGGAVSTLIESLIRENSKKGLCKFTVFSYYDKKAFELSKKYSNVKFVWVKIPKYIKRLDIAFFNIVSKVKSTKAISYKSIFSLLYYIKYVAHYLKKNKFDRLVIENNVPLIWTIRLSRYKGNYYYHFHNVPRISAGSKSNFKNCSGFLCVSKYVASEIESNRSPIGPINRKKVKVLYNAIDLNLFKAYDLNDIKIAKDRIRKKYNIKSNQKILLFTGRLSREKGLDILLDAISKLKKDRYKLFIVGSIMHGSNQTNEYLKLIKKKINSISNNVIFTGYIKHSALPDYYNAADVVVLPSMWEEPAGLTMIEALACGASVITTQSGGIPEYVANDAILIKRDAMLVNNLVLNIDKVLAKPDVYRGKGIQRIKNNFSEDNYLKRFIEDV